MDDEETNEMPQQQAIPEPDEVKTLDYGTIERVHISPIGQFEGSAADGTPIKESIDAEALQAIADSLNSSGREVLADIDHGAAKPGVERETRAAGWFTRFVVDPLRGLFASLKLTKHGRELLESREFRYISPTYTLDEDGRPTELLTASLTNTPAFQGFIDPILNQAPSKDGEVDEKSKSMDEDRSKDEELAKFVKEIVLKTLDEIREAEDTAKADEKTEDADVKSEDKAVENTEAAGSEADGKDKDKPDDTACNEQAESEGSDEAKTDDEPKRDDEDKTEVIKLEALNSAPKPSMAGGVEPWRSLSGQEFWNWLKKHPEAL